jgi:hypothetical protein
MKKLSVLIVVFSLLLFACIEESVTSGKFWAQNISTSSYYQVDAELLIENDLCYVWAEKGSGVTQAEAQSVADAYQNDIYNKMMNTFGYRINLTDDNGKSLAVLNTVELANYLATDNLKGGKLTILLLDIKDGYQKDVNDSYVAGYFWAGNLLDIAYSNKCDMIYVDTSPGIPGSKESNETLAHEMQHLMNFVSSVVFRVKDKTLYAMDLWIDEGLSTVAEWVYNNEQHSVQRLGCYNIDVSGLLGLGNNFFVWGNRVGDGDGKSQYAVLDDYSTAYLFFQWLRLQSDKEIYGEISISKDYDYNAVINAFNKILKSNVYSNWEPMLKDWLAANYFKNPSGRYGYGSDTVLNDIKRHYTPAGGGTISLFPGEGVYSNVTESFSIPSPGTGNIKYAGLNGSAPVTSASISSGALLTYNANTAANGAAESGTITGKAPPPSANIFLTPSGSRSIAASIGPFPISAGDMLRRRGKGSFYPDGVNLKIPGAYRGVVVNE